MLQRVFALGLVVLVASALAAAYQDDDKGKDAPYVKIVNKLQSMLASHKGTEKEDARILSYVRIDEYRYPEGKDIKVDFSGRSLRPKAKVQKAFEDFIKQTLPGLLKKDDKEDIKISEVKFNDKNFFAPETNPVHIDWQASPKTAALDGVLFLDAYYLEDGTMQVLYLQDSDAQNAAVKGIVKAWEDEAITDAEKARREKLGKVRETEFFAIGLREKKEDPSWTQQLRKHLLEAAKKGGESGTLFRQTRITRITWEHDKDGKARAVLHGISIYQPPADKKDALKETPQDTLQEELFTAFKDLVKGLRERVQAEQKDKPNPARERALELQPFSSEPALEIKGISILAKDPVLGLREGLNGAVLGGHQFDEEGVLHLSGIVRNKEQRKEIEKKLADVLKEKGIKVNAEKMKELNEEKLPQLLQKILAAAAGAEGLRRTRLDRASFRYVTIGKNEPELHLVFHGVHLSEAGLTDEEKKKLSDKEKKDIFDKRAKTTREAIQGALQKVASKALEDEIEVKLPPLTVVADAIAVSEDSPRNDLQGLVYGHGDLAGVRVKELAFDKDGKLIMDIKGANDAQKKVVEKLANEMKRLQELLKKPKDDGKVSRGNSEAIRSRHVPVAQVIDDTDKPHDAALRQLQQQLSADPALARTRIDRYGWKYDGPNAKLLVNGVAIGADRMKEISAKLIPLIEKAEGEKTTVKVATPDRFVVQAISPVIALQESSAKIAELGGMLVTDVYYSPGGRLTLTVLSPNRKRQETQIKTLVGERAGLSAEFVAAPPWSKDKDAGTLNLDIREPQSTTAKGKDWPAFITDLRTSLAEGSRLERQTYIESAHFLYGKDEQTLLLVFKGVCLDAAKDRNRVGKILQIAADSYIKEYLKPDDAARVRDHHAGWTADAQVEFETPQRGLQAVVADTPSLDGVGIAAAFFDKEGGLIFEGIYQDKEQEKPLGEVTKEFLKEKGKSLKRAKFSFELKPLDTRSILRDLRQYAADNLSEVWIARLFFDGDGTLTGKGILADDKEYNKVRDELVRLIRKHPKMKGHFKVENLTSIATEAPEGTPLLDLKQQGPLAAELRERYQGRSSKKRPPPSPRWDGIMIRRGYYTVDGKFGLDGLCDSAKQRDELNKDLQPLRKQTPFLDAFAVGVDVSKMRPLPLEPMLERMRLVMPAHETFDGIYVEGANHDVDNKLILRVQVIGDEPNDKKGAAIQKQLLDHKEWWVRAKEGIVWVEVGTPRAADLRIGDELSRRAIADMRRVLNDPKMLKCIIISNEDQTPLPAYFDRALSQATTSLMHDSRTSTTWFVRSMYFLLRNDRVRAARDLRRMYEIELDEDRGPEQAR